MQKNVLHRLLNISRLLNCNNYPSVKDLSADFEVSQRTIKRDINTLKTQHSAPIEYNRTKKGFYLTEKWTFSLPSLTESEIISLLLVTSTLKQFHGTPLQESLKSIEDKLDVLFSNTITIKPEQFHMLMSVNPSPIMVKTEIKDTFQKILKALYSRKQVRIEYFSMHNESTSSRTIDPYHIFHDNGVWYFCGLCHLRKEIRDFAMDRIKKIQITKTNYKIPAIFNPSKYFEDCFQIIKGAVEEIQIQFDPPKAKYIRERIFHSSQSIEEKPNGSLLLTIKSNPTEIKRWVLKYGSSATIIKPKHLRDEIKNDIKKMMENYK